MDQIGVANAMERDVGDTMWVKICGNTNLEDAALAAELGADAVGFVFAASKRQVTAAQVAAITARLPAAVERIGVFDSQDAVQIAATARDAGLTAVQLHGGFDEALLRRLAERFARNAPSIRIIQTLHWSVDGQTESSAELLAVQMERVAGMGAADRVLIDSRLGAASGGTGVAFDWAAARRLFAAAPSGVRLIVAGGLTPENVAEAIGELAPWGVAVSSGVEVSVGRKDPDRLARFIDHARAAAKA
jgi:phosphoribosylanthranilate isomerase